MRLWVVFCWKVTITFTCVLRPRPPEEVEDGEREPSGALWAVSAAATPRPMRLIVVRISGVGVATFILQVEGPRLTLGSFSVLRGVLWSQDLNSD